MLSAKPLESCRGVHIGHGDDRYSSICVGSGAVDLLQLLPTLCNGIDIGHVGHGASCSQIGQNHRLIQTREHIRRLGHKVNTAEDDCLSVRLCSRRLCKLKGVTDKICILNDLVPLIEVAHNHCT